MNPTDPIQFDADHRLLICRGDWDLAHIKQIQAALKRIPVPEEGEITIDGKSVTKMDSAGSYILKKYLNSLKKKGITFHLIHFSSQSEKLLTLVKETETKPHKPRRLSNLASIGKASLEELQELQEYFAFIGLLTMETLRIGFNPKHWRIPSLAAVIYRTGYLALPIIALLSFMIGVVITYQMALHLRNYGADAFIVDLLGIGILREFGPLLTAIMVAGRTGSSYTAQIGMMKLNQEIDALDIMGVTPTELLLLPRILGLFVVLPLLTIWSDFFGVFGGMVMANNMLNIPWHDFLNRFSHVVGVKHLIIGLGKAPVFALIIASVGCFQGMKVEGSAESVGLNTTKSVVIAIFFIIVADAAFSIIFSKLKL